MSGPVYLTILLLVVVQSTVRGFPDSDDRPRFCINGTECTDNECCLNYDPGLIVVGRSVVNDPVRRGVCERLGHYNSDCPLSSSAGNPVPSGKPEELITAKACPCQSLYTCTQADIEPGLGICS